MNNKEILSHIDHTLLRATATWAEIEQLCEEAVAYGTASVCVPPCTVKQIRAAYPNLNICTVIGFPLGYSATEVKEFETKQALRDGANEIDMVVNLIAVKNGDFGQVEAEIKTLKQAVGSQILKVIIETCYLTEPEKIALCQAVTKAGADYIKTSTGFGTDGARIEDINLFREEIGPDVKIKAAGGVKSKADLEMFLQAGCERIGTSSAVKLLKGESAQSY